MGPMGDNGFNDIVLVLDILSHFCVSFTFPLFCKGLSSNYCDMLTIHPVVSAITDVDVPASSRIGVQAGLVGGVTRVNRTAAVRRSHILHETCMQRHTRPRVGINCILLYRLSNK
jgi:hypothetical protein